MSELTSEVDKLIKNHNKLLKFRLLTFCLVVNNIIFSYNYFYDIDTYIVITNPQQVCTHYKPNTSVYDIGNLLKSTHI